MVREICRDAAFLAQKAEAAAADVPHSAVCQRHGKAACAVVIHSQSVHSLSC